MRGVRGGCAVRVLAVCLAALALAGVAGGCGRTLFARSSLPGGRATGPGFWFELRPGWSVARLNEMGNQALDAELAHHAPGLDPSGIVFSNFWTRATPSRILVDVVVEPITADSPLSTVLRSEITTARSVSSERQVSSTPTVVAGDAAETTTFVGGNLVAVDVLVKHGTWAYTLSTQSPSSPSNRRQLDSVVQRIVASWRWTPLSVAASAELSKIRDVTGNGYTVTIPLGWRATDHASLVRAGANPTLDSLWRGYIGPQGVTTANVVELARPSDTLSQQAQQGLIDDRAALGAQASDLTLKRLGNGSVAGVPAVIIGGQYTLQGLRLRDLQLVFDHGTRQYAVTLTAPAYRFSTDYAQLEQTLGTWRWQ